MWCTHDGEAVPGTEAFPHCLNSLMPPIKIERFLLTDHEKVMFKRVGRGRELERFSMHLKIQ